MKLKCKCPVCGSDRIATAVKKPPGPFVKDGPTVMDKMPQVRLLLDGAAARRAVNGLNHEIHLRKES